MGALVERHYVISGEKTTDNLPGVITPIPAEAYERATQRIKTIGAAGERSLGKVVDETRYYIFEGDNVFMKHGLAQAGKALTSDNEEGFRMTRLFANSTEDMGALERECALYEEATAK